MPNFFHPDSSLAPSVSSLDDSSTSLGGTRKRKVHFSVCKFTYIEPDEEHYDPPLQPNEMYYTKGEWVQVRMETSLTLKMIMANDPKLYEDNEEFCTRGVMELLPENLRRRWIGQVRILRSLLREQTRQQQLGLDDPEAIAEACRQLSIMDLIRAQNQAVEDARVAYEILHERDPEMKEEQENTNEAVDLPSTVFFQRMKGSKKNDAFGSVKCQCDSSDTEATYVTDDLSERWLYNDGDDDHTYLDQNSNDDSGPVQRITLLEPHPTLVQHIIRIFRQKPCWAK